MINWDEDSQVEIQDLVRRSCRILGLGNDSTNFIGAVVSCGGNADAFRSMVGNLKVSNLVPCLNAFFHGSEAGEMTSSGRAVLNEVVFGCPKFNDPITTEMVREKVMMIVWHAYEKKRATA